MRLAFDDLGEVDVAAPDVSSARLAEAQIVVVTAPVLPRVGAASHRTSRAPSSRSRVLVPCRILIEQIKGGRGSAALASDVLDALQLSVKCDTPRARLSSTCITVQQRQRRQANPTRAQTGAPACAMTRHSPTGAQEVLFPTCSSR